MTAEKLAARYTEAATILDDVDGLEVIEEGSWEQEHKMQDRVSIVKFEGAYYSVQETRSGSYHSDWYYGDTYIYPVERRKETKVVISWPATGPLVTVAGGY